jgi:hypothetical protein
MQEATRTKSSEQKENVKSEPTKYQVESVGGVKFY